MHSPQLSIGRVPWRVGAKGLHKVTPSNRSHLRGLLEGRGGELSESRRKKREGRLLLFLRGYSAHTGSAQDVPSWWLTMMCPVVAWPLRASWWKCVNASSILHCSRHTSDSPPLLPTSFLSLNLFPPPFYFFIITFHSLTSKNSDL